jgi:hypothetical protein
LFVPAFKTISSICLDRQPKGSRASKTSNITSAASTTFLNSLKYAFLELSEKPSRKKKKKKDEKKKGETFSYVNEEKKSSYDNSQEPLVNKEKEKNFKEEWKKLISESLELGLTLEESLKEKEPSNEQEFKELEKQLQEKYFISALSFEKEVLPSSLEPETFLKKIKIEKGRSSKDIFLLSKSKYSFMKLGFKFETYLGAGKKKMKKI